MKIVALLKGLWSRAQLMGEDVPLAGTSPWHDWDMIAYEPGEIWNMTEGLCAVTYHIWKFKVQMGLAHKVNNTH
eukprot:13374157-Heterocapsa_arctica.AAC.1